MTVHVRFKERDHPRHPKGTRDGGKFCDKDAPVVRVRLKYSDAQPRVPAGSPDGGQWTAGGSVVLPDDPTRSEFVDARLWEKRGYESSVPVYVRESDLPPVKEGMVRFYHGTRAENVRGITQDGLRTGSETGYGEQLRVVLGYVGSRSEFGDASIVADLPAKDVHMVNRQWAEVGRTIKPSEIRGVLINKISTSDFMDLIPIYREWQEMGGSMN